MADAAKNGIGPDIVIAVSSSTHQAEFWQNRLTGSDNIHASGVVIKKEAIVLSITESNWKGGAGNALGTLNGFLQAAQKAIDLGIILPGKSNELTVKTETFFEFCQGKSAFMYHTAGKGTRVAPLPGAEVNSKSNIKLPRMIEVDGKREVMTMLEAVLEATSIFAPSRESRLGVFWGDQVIINEKDIAFEGRHHVEMFGKMVALDEEIKSYGVLIPDEGNCCRQVEKLSLEEVKALMPEGTDSVYRSLGSFTVSLGFLKELMTLEDHAKALLEGEGSLDTDPDWWQPLTSEKANYIEYIMKRKDITEDEAASRWEKMNTLWNEFTQDPSSSCLDCKIGLKDLGKDAIWWDYGQNLYYLNNILLLVRDSLEGRLARIFFGIEENEWVDVFSKTNTAEINKSVIIGSDIGEGNVDNCVIVASNIKTAEVKNALIIGSTCIRINAENAICYNVVEENVKLESGHVLANIYHPEKGRIPMRTDTERNGQKDWKEKALIYENTCAYPEIAELMRGVKIEDVEKIREEERGKLTKNK